MRTLTLREPGQNDYYFGALTLPSDMPVRSIELDAVAVLVVMEALVTIGVRLAFGSASGRHRPDAGSR